MDGGSAAPEVPVDLISFPAHEHHVSSPRLSGSGFRGS